MVKTIVWQALLGLDFLHNNGAFHRDIKPENLLYSKHGDDLVVKIADFGLAKELPKLGQAKQHTDYVATRWYRAPELLLQMSSYDQKVDIFALGCIAVELLRILPLATGHNEADQL